MITRKALFVVLFATLFAFACGDSTKTADVPEPAPADQAKPAPAPVEAPVKLTEAEKKEAQAGITKENADSEADKLLKEIDGI